MNQLSNIIREIKKHRTSDPLVKQRQKDNKEILNYLTELIEKHPDQRFGQLLVNSHILEVVNGNVKDPFFEESGTTLKRIKK